LRPVKVFHHPFFKKPTNTCAAFCCKLDCLELDVFFDEQIDFCGLLNSSWSRHMCFFGAQAVPSLSGHDPLS